MAAEASANPLYADESYKKRFAQLHDDPDYRAKVHNQEVYTKISKGVKVSWTDEEIRARHMANRTGKQYNQKMSEAGKKSWSDNREEIIARNAANFRQDAHTRHSGRYDYSEVDYIDTRTPITVRCNRCQHLFEQLPITHLRSSRCPRCNISEGQLELYEWVSSWAECLLNDRKAIQPLEIDIYIPECNLGIEFHGIYWHSYNTKETPEQRTRHQKKALIAKQSGIRLLQFYDIEWYTKRHIVMSMINHAAHKTRNIISARNTAVSEIKDQVAREFFDGNHLAGHRSASNTICLSDDLGTIMAMSLTADGKNSHEVIRMATRSGWSVPGGVGKLLSHAHKKLGGIFNTFSDLRHSYGNCYLNVGFGGGRITPPGYFYHNNGIILSRQKCQKHKLSDLLGSKFDPSRSESENMFAAGYRRCWNAGNLKWSTLH